MEPTPEQIFALFQDVLFLTNAYTSIHLVRIDERSGNVIILAGETIEVEIYPNSRRIVR